MSLRTLTHFAVASLALCAGLQAQPGAPAMDAPEDDDVVVVRVSDPIEGVNRAVFRFNDGFYTYVAAPVAKGYETAVPDAARIGVDNILANLLFPVRAVGSVLQGKFSRAGQEAGKFLINTTVGVGGLVRASDEYAALKDVPKEDVGQALGSWGIGAGPYLVIPFMGPTTARDFIGSFGDRYATPWNWDWVSFYEWEWATAAQVTSIVSGLPAQLRTYDAATGAAPDPYVAVRQGYVQFRQFEVSR